MSHPICHVEPAETSSRREHILLVVFRYARSFDKLRMTRIILNSYTEKYQADNLAKLWHEFLSVTRLLAKIFGAVSRTTSLMCSRRCLLSSDAVAAMTAFVRMKNKKGTAGNKTQRTKRT